MTKQTGKSRRHDDAHGGQQHRLAYNRLCGFPARTETAVEHDEYQGYGTQVLGKGLIFQLNRNDAHVAEHDTQQDKCQERRNPDPGRNVIEPDAGNDNDDNEDKEEGYHTKSVFVQVAKTTKRVFASANIPFLLFCGKVGVNIVHY